VKIQPAASINGFQCTFDFKTVYKASMPLLSAQNGRSHLEQLTSRSRFAIFKLATLIPVCIILAITTGCAKKPRLAVAPVRGTVTYKGRGVPNAVVIFFPVDETAEIVKKLRPFAYADDQGNFEIKTYVNGDGAPPGKYRVSVVAVSSAPTTSHDASPANQGERKMVVAIPPEVTKKYGNVETSGLQVTVESGENNLAPFTL
jgi:hypothetical protein